MGGENVILNKQQLDDYEAQMKARGYAWGLHLIETLRAAWNERDDYRAILQEIRDGSDSPQYIASCILARYGWR
jgi:hypothetical protein